jgi:hypothetical protein
MLFVLCRLSDALLLWQDMEIDIPKFWQYVGETVSPVVEDGTVALGALTDACQSLLEPGKAGVFFAEIVHAIARKQVPRQHKVITLEKVDVQLHHTDNAWKPNPLKAAPEASANTAEEVSLFLVFVFTF